MIIVLSLLTSVKDYIEIVHKLVETNTSPSFDIPNYNDFGAFLSYCVLILKESLGGFLTFRWLQNLGSLPVLIPDISRAMLSEISVLDGYFHNAFTFLENRVSYGDQNLIFYTLEKFTIGLINSFFLCLPTSTAHIITLRRFVMQGLEAGYLSGLGTLAGNIVWIGSIVFGLRFIVIPWLSFDVFRYGLGFLLLINYMWDSYNERGTVLEDVSKRKIFLLNFLLALTEQATIYPFLSNLSVGSDATFLESFPTGSLFEYSLVHFAYLGGLVLGSLSLLQFTCWFWENPAFNIYMWTVSSLKLTTTFSQKFVNIFFLYLTMFFAVSNLSYFGLDYTLSNPLGFVYEDRLVDQKGILEISFLNTKASDRNTRRNRGRHGRRERWKRRVRRYRTFDVSLYDQGVYDLFTIEDLNYGFDRFWLRRKIRNHRVRFRFFPGPWMRSFKKQLARPRLESFMGPRVEFFRILFEQAYHPEFHEFKKPISSDIKEKNSTSTILNSLKTPNLISFYSERQQKYQTENLLKEHSALRKFVRKALIRTNVAQVLAESSSNNLISETAIKPIYSRRWKEVFSKISHETSPSAFQQNHFSIKLLNQFSEKNLGNSKFKISNFQNYFDNKLGGSTQSMRSIKNSAELLLSKKDRQILRYKTFLNQKNSEVKGSKEKTYKTLTLLHPLKYYLQKEKAFQKKLNFYGATLFRKFGIENNAPYYRVMMKKFFYYYKPTLRWERTLRTATMRKARRKGPRIPRKLNTTKKMQMLAIQDASTFNTVNLQNQEIGLDKNKKTEIQRPTHFYSLVGKRATRYRYQIYKDVLQHWYYSPFNRLLLKLDVDSFIRRQPQSHFITKKEENLLHLKRFLLADYYNTLRWYGYMEHYDVMKEKIGKTKSFASGAYNQQFFGTFKKIRHLFAITPSLTEGNVLKFDQPLFNEYPTNEKKTNQDFSLYNAANIHEELLADEEIYAKAKSIDDLPQDLSNQSLTILKEYLTRVTPIRKEYIEKLLKDENYSELMNFLIKGQKIRGTRPITNEISLFDQEKNYLLSTNQQENRKEAIKFFFEQKLKKVNETTNTNSLWLALMKKSQNMLYDQEALKRYVSSRVDKLEKQKRRQEKMFKTRLETMRRWVSLPDSDLIKNNESNLQTTELSGLTTSLQKAIKEGIYYHLFSSQSGSTKYTMEKSNLRNNRPNILTNVPQLDKKIDKVSVSKNISLKLKQHLNDRLKMRTLRTFESEQRLKTSFALFQKNASKEILQNVQPNLLNKIFMRTLFPFKQVSITINQSVRSLLDLEIVNRTVQPIKQITRFFIQNKQKTLNDWKQKETVFSARKKIRRKIYRVLDQKKQLQKRLTTTELENLNELNLPRTSRQKNDSLNWNSIFPQQKNWTVYENSILQTKNDIYEGKNSKSDLSTKRLSTIFEKTFKRKRTRSRRYRRFKGRGPIKKHTLAEKLKRQFKLLKRYGEKQEGQNKKMEVFQMITKKVYNPSNTFEIRTVKQRRTRQSKHRYWKKHKRQKYLQLKRKQRKRRRYSLSKLRVLNKQYKRIRSQLNLKDWWWKHFLPNFIATNEAFWETEKTEKIKEELSNLSITEILKRDKSLNEELGGVLQVGNQDYKPLIFPETLRLRKTLINEGRVRVDNFSKPLSTLGSEPKETDFSNFNSLFVPNDKSKSTNNSQNEQNVFNDITKNLFDPSKSIVIKKVTETKDSKKLVSINPIPFYAGWDENLRQFIVTNRLLSRKDAGYSMNLSNLHSPKLFSELSNETSISNQIIFTKAPLLGMNAATTLYWQIPFTTYDPDQFFALGMDGFSPLGWRFFNFKHSKQTTKPICINNVYSTTKNLHDKQSLFSYNLQLKMLDLTLKDSFIKSNQTSKNQTRKIQKRQKRVKKHPRPPVWFPSGPLSNQILPVHYIYVFYKRTRLPRDRYIGRRFRRSDDVKASFLKTNFTRILDFTLRKRVKPIRKYHRKVFAKKNEEKNLIVRRRPFKNLFTEAITFRPIGKTRLATDTTMLNASLLKTNTRQKTLKTKQNSENLRIRQLRRRIQRQVLRPIWRYKPRPGGIVWPGDYLRYELIKAPILNDLSNQSRPYNSNVSLRKKKRRNIQEWQVQPKKYLLEKHNLKVFRKRLQNSENLMNTSQKIKELKLTY
jgi:hypothetical protein